MVIGESIPGVILFVVSCLSNEDVQLLPDPLITLKYDFVVHFTSNDIIFTPEYLQHFDPNQKALCFLPSGRITFPSIALLYSASASLAPSLFPPLIVYSDNNSNNDNINSNNEDINNNILGRNAIPSLTYAFAPVEKKQFIEPISNPEISEIPENHEISLETPETFSVTFLGTGSMAPSRYRNVPGILIHSQTGFIVLDVGEGFAGQLRRRFGNENFKYIVQNINFIYISHIHGDHHFGLFQLLEERSKVANNIVPLLCHQSIAIHIENCQKFSKSGNLKYRWIKTNNKENKGEFEENGIYIKYFPVFHCEDSQGCVITLNDGWRIAYSGDRFPKDNFENEVKNCDLLIHEATFTDELYKTAESKGHSTMGQALATGKAVSAKYEILTHFSQRYPKLPVFPEGMKNIAFAFDYMTISYEKMNELCMVCPQIFQMISELEEAEKDDE